MNFLDRTIDEQQIIAVLRAPIYKGVEELAAIAAESGLSLLEVTMTGANALEAIETVSSVDGVVVGAGTVLSADGARSAADAGARFIVAPGHLPEVANATNLPTMLGALTPTEILSAARSTRWFVKVFPAAAFGPDYLRVIRGPLPDCRLVASGGVDGSNAGSYIAAGAAAVATGWLTPADSLVRGDHSQLGQRVEQMRRSILRSPQSH